MQCPTPDLLVQNLHFSKIAGDVASHYSVRNTRAEAQIWLCLSPALRPPKAATTLRTKPKPLLTLKTFSDPTSIYLPCQLFSSCPYTPATPNPSWHPALPSASLLTWLMPPWPSFLDASRWPASRVSPTPTSSVKPVWLNPSTVLIPHKVASEPPRELHTFYFFNP